MMKIQTKPKLPSLVHDEPNLSAANLPRSIAEGENRESPRAGLSSKKLGQNSALTKRLSSKRSSRLFGGTVVQKEPVLSSEQMIGYEYDPNLARDEKIVVTVKTTLQVHKNDRQEEQLKQPSPDVFGREAARHYVRGFVAAFSLDHDRFHWSLAESEWAFSALEPYAVDVCGDKMALCGANYVKLISLVTGEVTPVSHPWLSQCHTVQFSTDGNRLLVASSGFDAVVEFDSNNQKVVWEWFAWDHGYDRSKLGHYVVRTAERSNALKAMGHEVLLVDDPRKYEFGIPTRISPAHLNSAYCDGDESILVTLFHQGNGIIVDKPTGSVREVIGGLMNPHKLSRRHGGGYVISDTRRGKLIFVDAKLRPFREITLAAMPGNERPDRLSEFLQNSTELKKDLFACVDIHRNTLWLVNVQRRSYRGIKFPVEWSMHDVASLNQSHQTQIGSLVGTALGRVEASVQDRKVIRHFFPDGREIATLTLDENGRCNELDVQM